MKTSRMFVLLGATAITLSMAAASNAGGLERGGYNVDLLFDASPFAGEVTGAYVMPNRKFNNVRDINPLNGVGSDGLGGGDTDGVRDTRNYWVPRVGFKATIGGGFDCMADYSQPWGVHTNPGANWAGANDNIETKIESNNYAATCSYKMDAGQGQFRILGGVFYQEVSGFKIRQVAPDFAVPGNGIGKLELEGDGVGWRIGAAYEITDIALRASLVYNSAVDLGDITGTLDLSQVNGVVYDVFGTQKMPQSLEFKIQSGIAPDWLAFGSVKWVDWSQLGIVSFCSTAIQAAGLSCSYKGAGFLTSLDLLYRDGWTVSGGIGHKFNDQWSASAAITWDRGTTTGLNAQTDTWTVSGGVAYAPTQNVEMRVGGALGILTSGSAAPITIDGNTFGGEATYDFDNDLVSALSATLKVKW
ncbi:OmpP1/FadL family transporter [Oryzicola mucosus]|uniref:Transporter n=1 Tax=Oryzicola mucosus TaxID=2767425 RepID=A0A8J6PVB3_9HYPH|nr:OmpP1/FadL family transporter [Oryzicola mucosus]MBD0416564.1 transporter [Oryzicola mucosus]